jgi:hypothetical protein
VPAPNHKQWWLPLTKEVFRYMRTLHRWNAHPTMADIAATIAAAAGYNTIADMIKSVGRPYCLDAVQLVRAASASSQ